MPEEPAWIAEHVRAWRAKPALREYYIREHFDRIIAALADGPTLEIGCGPGFFGAYHPGMTRIDVTTQAGVDVCADAEALPFADETFVNVVWIDVLHHMTRPGTMLAEVTRVLSPGGRAVMIEPWTGPMGLLFYRYAHHEDCRPVPDPWNAAMAADKGAMDGNTFIPKALLVDRAEELSARVGPLSVVEVRPFGSLAYVMTGGFQPWGLPRTMVRVAARLERLLPTAVAALSALRVLYVCRKEAA